MKISIIAIAVTCLTPLCSAQTIAAGSKIYIEDAEGQSASLLARSHSRVDSSVKFDRGHGFDFYLTAALNEKRVPLIIVTEKAKADYCLQTTWEHIKSLGQKNSVLSNIEAPLTNGHSVRDYDGASIRLVDMRSSEVVFAYSVDRNNAPRGRQSAAESVAKHLKSSMQPSITQTAKRKAGGVYAWSTSKDNPAFRF